MYEKEKTRRRGRNRTYAAKRKSISSRSQGSRGPLELGSYMLVTALRYRKLISSVFTMDGAWAVPLGLKQDSNLCELPQSISSASP